MEEGAQCEREVVICAREQGGGTLQDGFSGKGGTANHGADRLSI